VSHRRRRVSDTATGDDPLALVPNLFDVSIVLAVAFLLAAISVTRNAATTNLAQGLEKAAQTVDRDDSAARKSGQGVRLGTAYRLDKGEVI
jgi:hypothetical protein